MTRIGDVPYLVKRTPNSCFNRSEQIIMEGDISASALYPSGPFDTYYNIKDITAYISPSSVNSRTLELGQTRRPFFEDQYRWIKNHYIASGVPSIAYYGSGVLAADESDAWTFNGSYSSFVHQLSGGGYSALTNAMNTVLGEEEVIFGKNRFSMSRNMCGGISWWTYGYDPNAARNSETYLAVRGVGWGKNVIQQDQSYQSLGLDVTGTVTDPPLPIVYGNPIHGGGWVQSPEFNFLDITIPNYYPDYYRANAGSTSFPIYRNNYLNASGEYIVETCGYPAEFIGQTDVDTINTGLATPETFYNAAESGGTTLCPVINKSIVYYQKIIMNFRGLEGVNMLYGGAYKPYEFFKSQYYNYSSAGEPVSALVSSLQIYNDFNIGCFPDSRFNKMYVYSPETNFLLDTSTVIVSGATTVDYMKPGTYGQSILLMCQDVISSINNFTLFRQFQTNALGLTEAQDKFIFGTSSPLSTSSNHNYVIWERTSDNLGNLPTVCLAVGTKQSTSALADPYNAYKAPMTLMGIMQGMPGSGVYGTPGFSATIVSGFAMGLNDIDMVDLNMESVAGCGTQNMPFTGAGWQMFQNFIIVGANIAEVLGKIQSFRDAYDAPVVVNALDIIPDIVRDYIVPFKAGNTF